MQSSNEKFVLVKFYRLVKSCNWWSEEAKLSVNYATLEIHNITTSNCFCCVRTSDTVNELVLAFNRFLYSQQSVSGQQNWRVYTVTSGQPCCSHFGTFPENQKWPWVNNRCAWFEQKHQWLWEIKIETTDCFELNIILQAFIRQHELRIHWACSVEAAFFWNWREKTLPIANHVINS